MSYNDGLCNSYGYAGAKTNINGVYCWRRINDTFDNYESLSDIKERAERQKESLACLNAYKGREYLCDPRYKRPTPIREKHI